MKQAVIGIGSNSLRMLIAEIDGDRMTRLKREREANRLFSGLNAKRELSRESMEKTVRTVAEMAEHARAEGAETLFLFATSATRDAVNQAELADMLKAGSGLELEVCSGPLEAELSFLGASEGRRCAVVDIGGGSTELVTGDENGIRDAISCQMGAVRLAEKMPLRNISELDAVIRAAGDILRGELAVRPLKEVPDAWIGTGGTFTTLAALLQQVHWSDRTHVHGYLLEAGQVRRIACELAEKTVEQRLQMMGMQPGRADIVVHGVAILLAIMAHFGVSRMQVSEYGNLEGYFRKRMQNG